MSFETAMIIACISGAIGVCTIILVIPEVKRRTNKKYPKYICSLVGIIGVALYISFLISMSETHLNSSSTYEEVPIKNLQLEKFTLKTKDIV